MYPDNSDIDVFWYDVAWRALTLHCDRWVSTVEFVMKSTLKAFTVQRKDQYSM